MKKIFGYYHMLSNGYFTHEPNRPKGFQNFSQGWRQGTNIPSGVMVSRTWRYLDEITPLWRNDLSEDYTSQKIIRAFESGRLKPIVFSDVDHAVMDRDAQLHVDQYIADRATLESLGFVAQFYQQLRDPSVYLHEIRNMATAEESYSLGQELFARALKRFPISYVKDGRLQDIEALMDKDQSLLSDDDYKYALDSINDSFYKLIVDPLGEYFFNEHRAPIADSDRTDAQSGMGRMDLIYTTIAAFSHVSIKEEYNMVRHETYGQFDARDHLYLGIRELFENLRQSDIESVGITRGNQVPYIKDSGSYLDDLFDRVHSTLISHNRRDKKKDSLYPKKCVRPYSQMNDNLSSEDKIRVIFHETLEKFNRAGISFSGSDDLLNSIATYLDHCVFITDSDLEVWGTCPVIAVVSLRTPAECDVELFYETSNAAPLPISVVNPLGIHGPGYSKFPSGMKNDFSIDNPDIKNIVDMLLESKPVVSQPARSDVSSSLLR